MQHRDFFFFSSRIRQTRSYGDWSSDVCSSDLRALEMQLGEARNRADELQGSVAPMQRQLEETRRQLEASANPSYAGLGDRAAQILRLAQDQASEALEEARREAD